MYLIIFGNPVKYGNLNNSSKWGDKDEYYTVHDEGYKYLNRKLKGIEDIVLKLDLVLQSAVILQQRF